MPVTFLPLAQSSISSGQLALIAVIIAVTAMMLISASRKRREAGPSARAMFREQRDQRREEKAVHADVSDVMLQLQQVAREINAQLDAKFLRLEQCLTQADERIEKLGELIADAGFAGVGRSGSTGTKINEKCILELARAGKSPVQIADAVGRPVGEIDLVLSLHRVARRVADDKAAATARRPANPVTSA